MGKIGISTVYTGFNYGSCLQAYASQKFISNMGYEVSLLSYKNSLVRGRDVRIEKLIIIVLRTILRPRLLKKTFLTYKNSLKKDINDDIKKKFFEFQANHLNIKKLTWRELREFSEDIETIACVCGSDQIWNATNVYIDPMFYLRFSPKSKRIAYAPSFGKDEIPSYNKKIIKKYIADFNYISVREEQGRMIIKNLIKKRVPSVLDPTLLLTKNEWIEIIDKHMKLPKKYILVYFLDKPTNNVISCISLLAEKYNLDIIAIPYKHEEFAKLKNLKYENAGPKQFLGLINNATIVCTDSFHGMVFSINFNKPFYIFERNYGVATNQSSRILSILGKLGAEDRFIKFENSDYIKEFRIDINYNKINYFLDMERKKSMEYLINSFKNIKNTKN